MTYRRRLPLMLGVLAFGWALAMAWVISGTVSAAKLTNEAPTPGLSEPVNGHVFYLRLNTLAGENNYANIGLYFNNKITTSEWDNQYIEISPNNLNAPPEAKVCNKNAGAMSPKEKREFIKVTITGGSTDTYYISYDRACSEKSGYNNQNTDPNNALFAKYRMPAKPGFIDSVTGRYLVLLTIEYNQAAPTGLATNQELNAFRFRISSSYDVPSGAKIGPAIGAYPILGSWISRNEYTTKITLPFGKCVMPSAYQTVQVGIQDADNARAPNDQFGTRKVRFRVKDVTDKDPKKQFLVGWTNGSQGHGSPNSRPDGHDDWFTPNNDIGPVLSYFKMKMYKEHKYELHIDGLAPLNTIVVNVPGSTIEGDVCNSPWELYPNTEVDKEALTIGQTATWTHTIENVSDEDAPADAADWQVYQTINGAKTTIPPGGKTPKITGGSLPWAVSGGPYTYTAKPADAGKTICQWVEVKPYKQGTTTMVPSTPKCVVVTPPPPPEAKWIYLRAIVPDIGDTETSELATFNGKVNVSGFPRPEVGGWGFNEVAVYGDPVRQSAQVQPYASTDTNAGQPTAVKRNCVAWSDPTNRTESNCTSWAWTCDGVYAGTGSSAPTCPTRYNHKCSTSTFSNTSPTGTCYDKWQCPSPSNQVFVQSSAPTCDVWRCAYGGPAYQSTNPDVKQHCEQRCESGAGPRPYKYPSDLNCYQKPTFNLTCIWDTGVTMTETVTADGDYCRTPPKPIQKQAGAIGSKVCALLTPREPAYPTGWQAAVLPGYGQKPQPDGPYYQINQYWWRAFPDQGCGRVVGKPYLKVYGGDVRVGGGVGIMSAQACAYNNGAGIKAYNKGSVGDYAGAGVQYAAMAGGFIDEFISGQYNNLGTDPSPGAPPTRLTFANTNGSYGGNFGTYSGPCYNYVEKLPESTQHITGDRTLPDTSAGDPSVFGPGKTLIKHIVGDVYINQNITYAPAVWTATSQIPLYQLVVEGNIYIGANVTQLDGLYVALPKNNDTTSGNIYTCATGLRSPVFLAFTVCKTQLVVNGAFAAKQVEFLRDCGSLRWSNPNEATQFTAGGGGDQLCGATNHAAEIFNFTPEIWIRSSSGGGSTKYDSISSMPPIL